jgi:hypothetical protein
MAGTPIDEIDFLFDTIPQTSPEGLERLTDGGLLVYGMYCDGFGYDFKNNRLADQADGVTFIQSPIIKFKPKHMAKPGKSEEFFKKPDDMINFYCPND